MIAGAIVLAANVAVAAGTGTPVRVTATEPGVHVFVARGDVDANGADDPFEDEGPAPLTIELAPGTYTFETGSPTTTTGHEVIRVGASPIDVRVQAGNGATRLAGSITMALGAIAAIAGVVVLASISANDENFPRLPVSLPLIFGGAAVFGGGYALTRAARTTLTTAPGVPVPPASVAPAAPQATLWYAPAVRF